MQIFLLRFFLFLPEYRLWHFMHIVSLGTHEMSMPCFVEKKENYWKMSSAEILPIMESINPCPAEPRYTLPLQTV